MYVYARLAARGAVDGILGSVVRTGIGLALGLTGASPLPLGGIGGIGGTVDAATRDTLLLDGQAYLLEN